MAAILMIGASLSAVVLGNMETQLTMTKGLTDVKRSVDTESVVLWKATASVRLPGKRSKQVPVAIHLYKQQQRVRVQILTHDVSQAEAEAVEDMICSALDAKVISRHYPTETELAEKNRSDLPASPQTVDQKRIQSNTPERTRRK
jgi:hypothetical protein